MSKTSVGAGVGQAGFPAAPRAGPDQRSTWSSLSNTRIVNTSELAEALVALDSWPRQVLHARRGRGTARWWIRRLGVRKLAVLVPGDLRDGIP